VSAGQGVGIRVRDLEIRYPGAGAPVLRDLDLDLPPGGALALVGESGSGKSVLLRALLGLAPVTRGGVYLGETDLARVSGARLRAVRRRVGMVFQSPVDSLDPRWPVRRAVAESLALRRGGGLRAHLDAAGELLDAVEIPRARRDALPGDLSGGECQRVAVARATAGEPDLVFADEPTAMLDPGVAERILELIVGLHDEMGFTLVVVTHHLRELRQLPGALLVLCAGRPVERADAAPAQPVHPFSRYIWDAAARPVEPVELASSGCPFRPGCPRRTDTCAASPEPVDISDGWRVWCNNPEATGPS